MSHTFRKNQSIVNDAKGAFRTSRRLQWCLVALLIFVPLAATWLTAHKRGQAEATQNAARKEAYLGSIFRFDGISKTGNTTALGVNAAGIPRDLRDILAFEIAKCLGTAAPDHAMRPGVLLPAFYEGGHFDRVFSGDLSILDQAEFFRRAGGIVLVRPSVRIREASVGGGMRTCSVDLAIREYSSLQAPLREISIHLVGTGFSDEASLRSALGSLNDTQKEKIRSILPSP